MIKTTQYKNTPIGPIPTDWEVKRLREVGKVFTGSTPPTNNLKNYGEEYLFVSPADLGTNKYITNTNKKLSSMGFSISRKFPSKSVLFTCIGSTIGKIGIATKELTSNQQINAIVPTNENDNEYIYYQLEINAPKIKLLAGEQAVPLINKSEFESIQIPLPPLPEQQKIAEVLSTWDKAIQDTDAIIKKLEARNKALAFSLLTGKKRVKGFEGKEFIKSLANEVFKSVSIKNNPEDSVLLSATQEFGMIPRDMIETRVTMPSGSLKTYKLVEKGDFVISLRSFQGGIEYSEYTGLVSPAYTVLKSINPINDDFYKYYFKSEDLIGRLSVAVIGIRDGKNISYDDFSTIVLPNPSLEEQNAIAEILNTANQEVKQYQQKLEALKLQKKGLMQQLLTGKVRTV